MGIRYQTRTGASQGRWPHGSGLPRGYSWGGGRELPGSEANCDCEASSSLALALLAGRPALCTVNMSELQNGRGDWSLCCEHVQCVCVGGGCAPSGSCLKMHPCVCVG